MALQTSSQLGRGHPSQHPTSLGAIGVSNLEPLALGTRRLDSRTAGPHLTRRPPVACHPQPYHFLKLSGTTGYQCTVCLPHKFSLLLSVDNIQTIIIASDQQCDVTLCETDIVICSESVSQMANSSEPSHISANSHTTNDSSVECGLHTPPNVKSRKQLVNWIEK